MESTRADRSRKYDTKWKGRETFQKIQNESEE